jgi:trigger factor
LNIQTEQLQNHTARMVVEFDVQRLAEAKKKAAQKIGKQVNIPGFRKGKAPYNIIAKYVGDAAISDEAIELISNDIYREALSESGLDPYGPGSVDKYDLDPMPTLTFTVSLQPKVDLKGYRDVRVPYEKTETTDENVDRSLRSLLLQHAVIEESQKPAALDDRVTMDIHSFVIPAEGSEDEKEEFIHDHDGQFMLNGDDEIAPGFNDAIVGAAPGDKREFDLTLPDDDPQFPGRKVSFEAEIKKVETVTLPALNDDFAARVTEKEETPLTLLELRVRVRENLQRMSEQAADDQYLDKVMKEIIDGADISYPEAVVADQIEGMMRRFDQRLRDQNKLTLRDYLQIARITPEQLYAQYKPSAEVTVKRSLVMREIARAEKLIVGDEEVAAEQSRMMATFGEDDTAQAQARTLFEHPLMQDQMRENLTRDRVLERIIAIGKGEAPEIPADEPVAEAPTEDAQT